MTNTPESPAAPSLDTELRRAGSPQAALDALHEALRELGREHSLHIRFYTGDLVLDLASYLPRAISGELARQRKERASSELKAKMAALGIETA